MSRVQPLSLDRHRALLVDPIAGAASRALFQIGRSEIALAAADMPLCLTKDAANGRFSLIALTGLVMPSNLFVVEERYQATYLPRAASLTGFRLDASGVEGLAVDEGDASLTGGGEPLFANDRPAPIVRDTREALERVIRDVEAARELADAYARHRLIRPLNLDLSFEDGGAHRIDGLYVLDEEALADLDDATVVAMHRADQLAPAAVLAASLAQIERLRQLHNFAHDRQIASFKLST